MEQQLIEQAPEGAMGYRLVLPMRQSEEWPRLSPAIEISGKMPSWGLCPFQAPDDIRLMDGQVYRVLWTGTSGEIIAPKQTERLPGLRFDLYVPEIETASNAAAPETGMPDRAESESVQSSADPASPVDDIDAEVQSMSAQMAQVLSEIDGLDTPSNDELTVTTLGWVPPQEWMEDFKNKGVRDALLGVERVWELSPALHEEQGSPSKKEPSSYQRFRTQLHGELAELIREAESKLADGTATSLLAERTELFIKNHLLKALDRWDLLLGITDPESTSKESLGRLAEQALSRVHCALLLWLEEMGITAFQPQHQQFNATIHHRHSQRHLSTVPAGHIVRVLRSGYLRDQKLLRRAHVIVAR